MKPTSMLNLKSWASKIHPPLTRTPRESQQLLTLLTSSFRRQLDQEFPPIDSTDAQATNEQVSPRRRPSSSAQSADRHLRSVLDHPLFNVVPSRPTAHASSTRRDGQYNQMKQRLGDPMATFDDKVAAGTATPAAVRQCLRDQLALIGAGTSSEKTVLESMKKSRAGSRVAAWFWGSDLDSRKHFFSSRDTMACLMKFMVAEDQHSTVFKWLSMLRRCSIRGEDGNISTSESEAFQQNVLIEYMAAQIAYGGGIRSALEYYLRTNDFVSSHETAEIRQASQKPLRYTGFYLARWIFEHNDSTEVSKLPQDVMSQFRMLSCQWSVGQAFGNFWTATIHLSHPTAPSATPALQYLAQYTDQKIQSLSAARRKSILKLCLDAARLCVSQQNYDDAARLLQNAQALLRAEEPQTEKSKDEELSPLGPVREELLRLDTALKLA